jgi:hypothetical protein
VNNLKNIMQEQEEERNKNSINFNVKEYGKRENSFKNEGKNKVNKKDRKEKEEVEFDMVKHLMESNKKIMGEEPLD